MWMPRVGVAAAIALLASPLVPLARAEVPEKAPAESRAQVAAALDALSPAFAGRTRRVAGGAPGSLEAAIAAYAPGIFHAVTEGALGAPRAGARCPEGMALVASRVCVDKYEASLVEKLADGTTRPHAVNESPAPGRAYVARSVAGVRPQAYVSGAQAAAACAAAGKRLCAPVEWRAACGGSQGFAFPYGPERQPGACHDSGVNPIVALYPGSVGRGLGARELNDPRNTELEGTLGKTGAYPECVNDYGIYDMVGNLDEWTSDPEGTFQGGFWLDTTLHGDGCAYRTIAHPFDYRDYSTGFRCCAEPEGR